MSLLTVLAMLQTSCTSKYIETGYSFGDAGINEANVHGYIPEGRVGEVQVMQLLGSPSIMEDMECRRFYYIQSTYLKKPILHPKLIDRKILEIDFNDQHIVSRVSFYEKRLQPDCKICSDETRIEGNQMKLIQQFARNIGRFNSAPGARNQQ